MDTLKITTLVLFIPVGVLLSDPALAEPSPVEACHGAATLEDDPNHDAAP